MSLLLHGVVGAEEDAASCQVDDEQAELHVVEAGGLAVVATVVPDGYTATEDDAVRHLDVLVGIVRDQPVLPLRLGTLAPDDRAVTQEILNAPIAEDLRRQLSAVQHLVELRMTFTLHEDQLQMLFNEDVDLRRLAAQTASDAGVYDRAELVSLVVERLSAKRAELVGTWVSTLEDLLEETLSLASSDEQREQIAMLARRERLAAIDEGVAALVTSVGVQAQVEYVGPLPIFSFGDVDSTEWAMEPFAASAAR